MRANEISIRKTVRGPVTNVPFEAIASAILPRPYALSVVVCGDTLARRINTAFRTNRIGKKPYSPNVLAFPIVKQEGELFLNVRKSEREARTLGIPAKERHIFLFIHGCLHLLGFDHGRKMEQLEKKFMRSYAK